MTAPVLPDRPQRPENYECCHRGCEPCIFDYYYAALERWVQRMRDLGLPVEDEPAR